MRRRPKPIGITLGDACGVGPEILVRAFAAGKMNTRFVVFGEPAALELAAERTRTPVKIRAIRNCPDAKDGALNLYTYRWLQTSDITIGQASRKCGEVAVSYLDLATRACLDRELRALVTLPINKEASRLSHPDFQGHTERIAGLCGVAAYGMMLAGSEMIVTHVSTHVSLRQAIERVTTQNVLQTIRLTHQNAGRLRPRVRLAVAGLNPHAGEHGAFGREEIEEIEPAVRAARTAGIDVVGPLPPDTVFYRMRSGEFDAVICMYHDQGHIPMKLLGFGDTVNITLGLPFVRTSVDHGTAFDIAYQGVAETGNFVHALAMADRLA